MKYVKAKGWEFYQTSANSGENVNEVIKAKTFLMIKGV